MPAIREPTNQRALALFPARLGWMLDAESGVNDGAQCAIGSLVAAQYGLFLG